MLTDAQREALMLHLRRGRDATPGQIPRRAGGLADLPLSHGQEQLWFLDRFAPGQPIYNIPLAIRLTGPLACDALGRALSALAARHEALRTRLVTGASGRPAQVIDPPGPVPLEVTDLTGFEPGKRPARLRDIIDAEAVRPFDLAAGPLLRASLLRLDQAEHVLMVVVHHAVFDGWSAGVFLRELAALYGWEAAGEPAGLPELPVQFADYALWERDRLAGPVLAGLEQYWRGAMSGFETLHVPTDRPRPVIDNFAGGLAERMMRAGLLGALRELSRREGTTLFVTLMAALAALLHRYTGQTDLVAGTVSANRSRAELAPLIGFLVNTVPVRADASGDPEFTTLLARVKDAALGAFAHQDLPFGKLVETLGVERDASRAPVFQVALTYAERDATPVHAAGVSFALTDLVVGIEAAKFDLTFAAEARADGLWVECSYKTALFDPATIERLLGHLEVLLRGITADPSARLSQLPLLTADELHAELVTWNDTAAPAPPGCVHEAFEAQAHRTPDAPAAQFEGGTLSYAELNQQASQIAHRLRELGAGPETLVGVCMPTGLRRLAALLGIWKAGAAYVPLDPALPPDRLAFMIEDTGMTTVLTGGPSQGSLPAAGRVTAVPLDAEWDQIAALPGDGPAGTGVTPGSAAYVIYTSGSTGQPKGVVVEHRSVASFLHAMIGRWDVGPSDVVLGFASLSFDASVHEMFMALLAGARLVLAPPGRLHSPARLAALMRSAGITFACLTPTVLSLLTGERFPALRVLMAGGEELPPELARRWLRPGLRFANDYGPTEATVTSTVAELHPGMTSPPPIGLPLPGYRAYVLDPHLHPVPVGVTGELHIGGAGVARGYLNRPGLTGRRFIPDPFATQPGARLYKTGDLVKRRPGGAIVFGGRADGQVKIHGLRIELGEVEAALASHPDVARAAAAVVTGPAGDGQLAGYLRPRPGAAPTAAALRGHLAAILPGYMIPAHLVTVAEFPLTASGKIDRAALPPPGRNATAAGRAAPATATQAALTGLFADVLGAPWAGAADSFFDLGGSSLSAMRLADAIRARLGVDAGIAAIFLHPTPRELAAVIDAGAVTGAGDGPLVELSAGSAGSGGVRGVVPPPLFLVHAIGGTVFCYAPLAAALSGAFTVYGIQSPGLTAGGAVPATLAELADDYTRRVRAACPAGPYRLGGWSMGGVVAFEIARRLARAGAEVALLALLDAPFTVPGGICEGGALAGGFAADVAHSLGWDAAGAPAGATVAGQLAWLAGRLRPGGERDRATMALLRRRFGVFSAHHRMLAGYRPDSSLRVPAIIVSARDSPNAPAADLWRNVLSGPVTTAAVDGDHYAFLRPPLVSGAAASIRTLHGGMQ